MLAKSNANFVESNDVKSKYDPGEAINKGETETTVVESSIQIPWRSTISAPPVHSRTKLSENVIVF